MRISVFFWNAKNHRGEVGGLGQGVEGLVGANSAHIGNGVCWEGPREEEGDRLRREGRGWLGRILPRPGDGLLGS